MRRLRTGYALWYNRSRNRRGHLFQNRFKSILCQEDAYLLELVRYIHLNPLRAGLVKSLDELTHYPFSAHCVLLGKVKRVWQETDEVLGMFGKKKGPSRRHYKDFVKKGMEQGKRKDLSGGGLIRSAGGWEGAKSSRRSVFSRRAMKGFRGKELARARGYSLVSS